MSIIVTGEAHGGLVFSYEHSTGAMRLRGSVLRSSDGARWELDGRPGETMSMLKQRLIQSLQTSCTTSLSKTACG